MSEHHPEHHVVHHKKEIASERISMVVAVLVLIFIIYNGSGDAWNNRKGVEKKKEPVYAPLVQGKETYFISSKSDGPKMQEVSFDPFDVKVGETQRVSLRIAHDVSVKEASITFKTDNASSKHILSLAKGTAFDGYWEADVVHEDTHNKVYDAALYVVDEAGKSSEVVLSMRYEI